jgi:arylformamidase
LKVIDISRELFNTPVYPGDPQPYRDLIRRMNMGDLYNLSGFYTGCHSATHVDAPRHFIEDGKTIDELGLERFTGKCTVVEASGIITGSDIDAILPKLEKMVLFKGEGEAFLDPSAAFALSDAGIMLVGTDAQSIEVENETYPVHKQLLGEEIPILEGLELSGVQPGNYRLIAFPLLLGGAEASPVRAVLMEE